MFGVALALAVERTPSNDGVLLPICVRECIDYIEEHGRYSESGRASSPNLTQN